MRLAFAILVLLAPALHAAELPAPPAERAVKATHVDYGRTLHAQASAEIARLEAELAAAADLRADVLARLDAVAITQSIQFSVSADGSITLTWEHDARGQPVGYRIYRSGDGRLFAPIATADERRYVDRDLLVGARYWYFVTAYNPAGESGPSNTESAPAN